MGGWPRFQKFVLRRRERCADYLRARVRDLRATPEWIEVTRGYGHTTGSEYEDDMASRGATWTTTTYNPAYRDVKHQLERLEEKLKQIESKLQRTLKEP